MTFTNTDSENLARAAKALERIADTEEGLIRLIEERERRLQEIALRQDAVYLARIAARSRAGEGAGVSRRQSGIVAAACLLTIAAIVLAAAALSQPPYV